MPKFRKKPIEVEAIRWTGSNFQELVNWGCPVKEISKDSKNLRILQGEVGVWSKEVSLYDWIVKEEDDFFVYSDDNFKKVYYDFTG